MSKETKQQGFWDYEASRQKSTRRKDFLIRMREIIPWKKLEAECVMAGVYGV